MDASFDDHLSSVYVRLFLCVSKRQIYLIKIMLTNLGSTLLLFDEKKWVQQSQRMLSFCFYNYVHMKPLQGQFMKQNDYFSNWFFAT